MCSLCVWARGIRGKSENVRKLYRHNLLIPYAVINHYLQIHLVKGGKKNMFAPPQPVMREYCERDAEGTGPVLDEGEGEEVGTRQ